jgi:hypothetical protein
MKNNINNILIELTDITGYESGNEKHRLAFFNAEEKVRQHIKDVLKDYIRVVDEHCYNHVSPDINYGDGCYDTLKILEEKYKQEYE